MFEQRSYQPELMDDLQLASEDLRKNLDELELINTLLGGYQVVLSALKTLVKQQQIRLEQPLRIADCGSGGGDTLRKIASWLAKYKHQWQLIGFDANQFMLDYATQKAAKFSGIRFEQADIFTEGFTKQQFDVILCSLFCHHFTDKQLVEMFSNFRKQSKILIINDLHRHWFAYYSIYWLTRLLGGSYLVRHDAPLSVWRAFRRTELESLLKEAGYQEFTVKWFWAFRYQVIAKA